ncbi:MAG: SUMF1/EgtB/PvdO family nonheme iron enzyme [Planctomycetes bacterium]|nr:SUMF1/EgtB/PvdO family nonheme iron enzyme [Planctomycetota bacterium]
MSQLLPAGTQPMLPELPGTAYELQAGRAEIAADMIGSHRSALLLRAKLACDVEDDALQAAAERFRKATCVVEAGPVRLSRWQVEAGANSGELSSADDIDVASLFLERNAITNEQFQLFLDRGGYENKSLWHASVWPCVKEFVDRTGSSGPRFWSDGHHCLNNADHPVVGVSWFEAEAYSRWIGMRLPTDAEWVRAACSPIEVDGAIVQRKYPWGESFSSDRANLRSSGVGHTLPTGAYAEGDSLGGAGQMIGNVWEWTASNLRLWNGEHMLELAEPMKSLRGSAFDSFLDVRATCQCQSADTPLARRHNIGFRCVVSACDVVEVLGQIDDGVALELGNEGIF